VAGDNAPLASTIQDDPLDQAHEALAATSRRDKVGKVVVLP
jgi:hypothetical protein